MSRLLFLNGWQASRGDGLSVALFFLAGDVKTNLLGEFREFFVQNLAGSRQNQVAAWSAHYTAKHEKIADLVKIGVMSDVVAEVDSDGFVDFARARIAGRDEVLDLNQFAGQRHVARKIDAGGLEQAAHGLLRKILGADARVAGPFVHGRVLAIIHGRKRELVEPGGDVALGSDVAGRQARSHGDAQHDD